MCTTCQGKDILSEAIKGCPVGAFSLHPVGVPILACNSAAIILTGLKSLNPSRPPVLQGQSRLAAHASLIMWHKATVAMCVPLHRARYEP